MGDNDAVASSSSSDWSELHEDYLQQILKKFTSVPDCLRFGSVCVSWRNILVPHLHPDLLHPQLPLLLIPTPPSSSTAATVEKEEQTRSFYNVSENRVYKDIEIKLPYNRHCRGSSHGWLITAGFEEDTGYAVELINPFVSINNQDYLKIQLPPLTALPQDPDHDIFGLEYFPKAVLSANPLTNPKDYVVMAIYGGYCHLAYWKPGDQVWNPVPWSWNDGTAKWEIIYHNGLYYIVNTQEDVFVCDLGSAGTTSISIDCEDDNQPHRPIEIWKIASTPIPNHPGGIEKYLVKLPSSGDLLMVHRFHTIERPGELFNPHSTDWFSVFKLLVEDKLSGDDQEFCIEEDEEGEEGPYSLKWTLMSYLENQMFFVGDNASISLPASKFPGGKPNHIYFTPDNVYDDYGYVDMGVFDYRGGNIEQIHPMGSNDYILPITTIWVEPMLRCCLRF